MIDEKKLLEWINSHLFCPCDIPSVEIKYLVEEIVKLKAEELNKSKRPPGQKQIMVCPRCGSQYPSDIQHMC